MSNYPIPGSEIAATYAPACIPFAGERIENCLALLDEHRERVRFFEVWLEYLNEDQLPMLYKAIADNPGRFILLSRRKGLEPSRRSEAWYLEIFRRCADKEVLVDFDILTQRSLLEAAVTVLSSGQLLLSTHDYKATPEYKQLRAVVNDMRTFNPRIVKIAAYCNEVQDALRLLTVQQECIKQDLVSIVLGMGKYGSVTRTFGSFWGNAMTFVAASDATATAPGQLTVNEYFEVMNLLEKVHAR